MNFFMSHTDLSLRLWGSSMKCDENVCVVTYGDVRGSAQEENHLGFYL